MSALQASPTCGRIDFGSLQRIAVFRALQLGDLLCTVPALRALRLAAPQAGITLIGLPWAQVFAERFSHYIDEYICFPGYPGFPETPAQIDKFPAFLADVQARKFDLALQLHGSGAISNPLTMSFGAAVSAGCYRAGEYCPDAEHFMPWDEREHEVLRYLDLFDFLGIPFRMTTQSTALEFPLLATDYQSLDNALQGSGVGLPPPGSYVCLHPGARLASRRWLPGRFAQVATGLIAQGWPVVLTGSAAERALADTVVQHVPPHIVEGGMLLDLCGHTSLGALAALVSGARLVVCNDTGISHIAAALETPSVIICSGADPQRWAPLDRQRHRLLFAAMPCRPCAYETCPIGHPCAENISAESVLNEALRLGSGNFAESKPELAASARHRLIPAALTAAGGQAHTRSTAP